jgi:membrane protease YdiL (CAAX protease family)
MCKLQLSRTVFLMFLISVCGVLALYNIQQRSGRWLYSTENLNKNITRELPIFETADISSNEEEDPMGSNLKNTRLANETVLDYGRVFHLLFGAPLIEEIVLRIALTTVIQRRLQSTIPSIIWTNVIFSLLHVINIMQNASSSYTLFQVFTGFILGTYYSTRMYITGNLFESLALHIMNNLTAIWIPVTITWKEIIPHFSIPLFATLLIYIILLSKDLLLIYKNEQRYVPIRESIPNAHVQPKLEPVPTNEKQESRRIRSKKIN